MTILICIYAKEASYVRKYLRTLKNSNVVNYMDISNKLTKNDIYAQEPSHLIINSHIIKVLEKLVTDKNSSSVYYVMSNFDPDTIHNLKKYIESLSNNNSIKFKALVRNKDLYKSVFFLFDDIEELEL